MKTGILDKDDRVELLDGALVTMSPQSELRARIIEHLNRLLVRSLGEEFRVRPQLPLRVSAHSAPEPDLAVVAATDSDSVVDHPTTALLVIEVAGDSLAKDHGVKSALYASAGVPEYVIVDLVGRRLEIFRRPDPGTGTWGEETAALESERARLESVGLELGVDELFR